MISASPYVLNELSAHGTVVGTHIKVRVVNGTRAKFMGEFDTVEEALRECQPDRIRGFLKGQKTLLEKVEEEGIILCGTPFSPSQVSQEMVG